MLKFRYLYSHQSILKSIIIKIVVIHLAALVVFASSFFYVDKHFCNGSLIDVSFFKEATNCGMEMPNCDQDIPLIDIFTNSCCVNTQDFKLVQEFEENLTDVNVFSLIKMVYGHNEKLHYKGLIDRENYRNFKKYIPPLIFKNILVFVQCFRL